MGLDGIEPSASALSVLAKGLVRRLVYPLTCPFVPRRATKRRVVPLRLGTLWARRRKPNRKAPPASRSSSHPIRGPPSRNKNYAMQRFSCAPF